MLLALVVGNTTVTMGAFEGTVLRHEWRVSTETRRTADEYGLMLFSLLEHAFLTPSDITAVAMSSVVPPLTQTLEMMCQRWFHCAPLVVGPGVKTGMIIRYDNPREVGADRIVAAVAGYEKYGGPLVVVDFGTATTFDAVSGEGEYLGGAIAPGIGISTEALFARASKLTRVELVKPRNAIGRNTVASMQSGIVFGFAGQVEAMISRIASELGGTRNVVATGGYAELIAGECKSITVVDPALLLEGLRLLYERNLGPVS